MCEVVRFADAEEARATLQVREGCAEAADFYLNRGRVLAGTDTTMPEAAYAAWLDDIRSGRDSLLLASSASTVAELNARARADLVLAGQVDVDGVPLRDGTSAGIITRTGVEPSASEAVRKRSRPQAKPSASEAIRDAVASIGDLRRMAAEYAYALGIHVGDRYRATAEATHPGVTANPAWPSVAHRLHVAEGAGWQAADILARADHMGGYTDARSDTRVLVFRLDLLLHASAMSSADATPVPIWLAVTYRSVYTVTGEAPLGPNQTATGSTTSRLDRGASRHRREPQCERRRKVVRRDSTARCARSRAHRHQRRLPQRQPAPDQPANSSQEPLHVRPATTDHVTSLGRPRPAADHRATPGPARPAPHRPRRELAR
jgi:hypothetical protein